MNETLDTRYARCTGVGESTLGVIKATAENALAMMNGDNPTGVFAQAYIKSALENIIGQSEQGQSTITEIMKRSH